MKCVSPHPLLGTPCGRCDACRINYTTMWAQRMIHEKLFHDKCVFVTLTYDDVHLPKPNTVRSDIEWLRRPLLKKDVQRFFKRLRKEISPKAISYYLGGEYGDDKKRPHYHVVLYGLGKEDHAIIEKAWGFGIVDCRDVTDGRCKYVAGYVLKKIFGKMSNLYYEQRGICKEFSLSSKNPAIGRRYVEKFGKEIAERGFTIVNGVRRLTPRYYLARLCNDNPDFKVRREQQISFNARERMVEKRKGIAEIGYSAYDKKVLDERKALKDNLLSLKNTKVRML